MSKDHTSSISRKTIHSENKHLAKAIPVPLYIYLSARSALDDILHLHLKLSDARKVNDPFEYSWKMDYPIPDEKKERIILQYKDEYASKLLFLPFSPLHDNILMWAYYAKNHAGMCLGFNFSDWFAKGNIEFGEVKYDAPVSIAPKVPTGKGIDLFGKLLLSKQESWQHENEWRALVPNNHENIEKSRDEHSFLKIPPLAFHSIIFGGRCSMENMGRAMLACLKSRIQPSFHRIRANYAKCGIEVVPVSEQDRNDCITLALLNGFSST